MITSAMFDSQTSRGPKLVYTHNRHGTPKLSDDGKETVIHSDRSTPTFHTSHTIPRPSVTVVAQTRKPSKEDNSDVSSNAGGVSSSSISADSSIMNAINRLTLAGGLTGQQRSPGRTETPDKYSRTIPIQYVGDMKGHSPSTVVVTGNKSKMATVGNATPKLDRIHDLDPNNNADNHNLGIATSSKDKGSGYHEGYRVYRGKVYEMGRDIPIIIESMDSNNTSTLGRYPSTFSPSNTNMSNGKGGHMSPASISTGQSVSGDVGISFSSEDQQPRALPGPRLNGKLPNGVPWYRIQTTSSESTDESDYDQPLPFHQQALFREHRRQLDEARQNARATTSSGRRQSSREFAPSNRPKRSGSVTSSSTARRHHSPQRSASVSRAHGPSKAGSVGSGGGGGQVWTVVTLKGGENTPNSKTQSSPFPTTTIGPRVRVNNPSVQQTSQRAPYRLDPGVSSNYQGSPTYQTSTSSPSPQVQPKSILKTSAAASGSNSVTSTASSTSNKVGPFPLPGDYHGNQDVTDSTHQSFVTLGDRANTTLPRPRAPIAYRDFDFSGIPPSYTQSLQHSTKTNTKTGNNKLLNFPINIPIAHEKGNSPSVSAGSSSVTVTRRPSTAGAAMQKGASGVYVGVKGSDGTPLPQKKTVTFNTEVRLHVDNNVSTIRSLSIDS